MAKIFFFYFKIDFYKQFFFSEHVECYRSECWLGLDFEICVKYFKNILPAECFGLWARSRSGWLLCPGPVGSGSCCGTPKSLFAPRLKVPSRWKALKIFEELLASMCFAQADFRLQKIFLTLKKSN